MIARAYYNEIDPYAAQWLRNLIAAGHIAPGEVDERSIVNVRPADLGGFGQCHFFAGIDGWSYAARLAGWPDDRPIWTGSCPCQPFSVAGKGEAQADKRHSGPNSFALSRPAAPLSLWESRLRQRLARIGSTECLLTWKASVTPAERPLSRLVPSMRPIAETDCGLWPTPSAQEFRTTDPVALMERRKRCKASAKNGNGFGLTLGNAVTLALWPAPTAINDTGGAALCKWGGTRSRAKLRGAVGMAVLNGALNPAWVSWLMGFPPAWDACAPTAMPSSRKSRPK